MPRPLNIAIGLLIILSVIGAFGWLMVRAVKRSDDPPKLIFKWVLTLISFGMLIWFISTVGFNFGGAFAIPFGCVAFAIVMSIMWTPSIGAWLVRPLTSLYDGGNQEIEPAPLYSMAIARRKNGKYQEAIYEVHKQLERFPNDFAGLLLLAEIQAENLNDLPAAELTLQRFCQQPGHPPKHLAYALNVLADWHLKYAQDAEAARRALEQILALCPDSHQAQLAAQRIAHLGSTEMLLGQHEPRTVQLHPGVQDVGLLRDPSVLKQPDDNLDVQASAWVQHLELHPLDSEVREKLALLYAGHFHRLDLALDQLEQLIQQPHQPMKKVAHYLNTIADLQVKHTDDYEAARTSLQRIVALFPNYAPAETARQRLAYLKLEFKGKEPGHAVKMGTYEQDLGLKKR